MKLKVMAVSFMFVGLILFVAFIDSFIYSGEPVLLALLPLPLFMMAAGGFVMRGYIKDAAVRKSGRCVEAAVIGVEDSNLRLGGGTRRPSGYGEMQLRVIAVYKGTQYRSRAVSPSLAHHVKERGTVDLYLSNDGGKHHYVDVAGTHKK
jgi:hypothetical protein